MKNEIIEHAAKAFFGLAWANMQDFAVEGAETVNLSGCEILDVCPEVDPSAIDYAQSLIADTERLNKMTIEEILELCKSDSDNCDRECNAEMFGHYLAMHAMGSGVGLESVTNELIKTPYAEDYSCEDFTKTPILEQDYS
jgi:hypothetical protein